MIYCEGCKFLIVQPDRKDGISFAKCGHEKAQEPASPNRFVSATLDVPSDQKYASIMRGYGDCGPDALLREEAP